MFTEIINDYSMRLKFKKGVHVLGIQNSIILQFYWEQRFVFMFLIQILFFLLFNRSTTILRHKSY